jgi:hypothetical protein
MAVVLIPLPKQVQKTICKRLMDAAFIDEFIDNPPAQLRVRIFSAPDLYLDKTLLCRLGTFLQAH